MNSRIENERLVIELVGRIDTSNASQVESEIESIISANKGLTPAFDAEKLEYISSIGLRILLKVAKTCGQKLQLLNASKDVYEFRKGLKEIGSITDYYVVPELKECKFMVACDVINPLCGSEGCSAVYGPQKGATPSMIMDMDKWLGYYAAITKEKYPHADAKYPGTGAAGGMGFAFLTFLNAELQPGIDIVLRETKLEDYIKDADLVVTGEGMLDFQTAMGKAPVGVAKLAKKYDKTVIAFAGGVTADARACNEKGIDAFFPIVRGITTLEEAMVNENAKKNLADTAEQVMRLFCLGK